MLNAFKTAIQVLSRFSFSGPFPASFAKGKVPELRRVIMFLPVVGLIGGIFFCGIATLLVWLTNGLLGALSAAVLIPLFAWWLTSGHDVRATIWLLQNCRAQDTAETDIYLRVTCFQGIMLLKVCCLALLINSGYVLWLVLTPVLAAATFGELCADLVRDGEEDETPLLQQSAHWLIAAAVALLVSGLMGHVVAGVSALVIAWLMAPALARLIPIWARAESGETVRRAAMAIVDLVMLLLGVLYFLSRS